MTKPYVLRLAAFVASALLAIWLFLSFHGWVSIAAAVAMLMLGVVVGQTLFQGFATRDEKIADLEDSSHNPPS